MIEKFERMAILFDFYGKLLTDRQQEMLNLYYGQDLSLGEIAAEFEVSRQAVHDIIRRAEKILEGFETKLGLVTKFNLEREKLEKVLDMIDQLEDNESLKEQIKKVIDEIVEIQQND